MRAADRSAPCDRRPPAAAWPPDAAMRTAPARERSWRCPCWARIGRRTAALPRRRGHTARRDLPPSGRAPVSLRPWASRRSAAAPGTAASRGGDPPRCRDTCAARRRRTEKSPSRGRRSARARPLRGRGPAARARRPNRRARAASRNSRRTARRRDRGRGSFRAGRSSPDSCRWSGRTDGRTGLPDRPASDARAAGSRASRRGRSAGCRPARRAAGRR